VAGSSHQSELPAKNPLAIDPCLFENKPLQRCISQNAPRAGSSFRFSPQLHPIDSNQTFRRSGRVSAQTGGCACVYNPGHQETIKENSVCWAFWFRSGNFPGSSLFSGSQSTRETIHPSQRVISRQFPGGFIFRSCRWSTFFNCNPHLPQVFAGTKRTAVVRAPRSSQKPNPC